MKLILLATTLVASLSLSATEINEIKILSYNVWGMPFPIRTKPKGLKIMPKELPKLKAHIIGMQEVFTKRAKKLGKMPEYPYKAWGADKKGIKVLSSGLLILSKFPITKRDTISFDSCSGMDCFARKGAQYARISIPHYGEIDVINTHLNAGKNKKVKIKQLEQLLKFVQSKKSHRPMILMGDFNFKPSDIYYEDFSTDFGLDDTHAIYLKDNPDAPQCMVNSYTYQLKIGPFETKRKLDYIWYIEGNFQNLNLKNYKIVYSQEDELPRLSDHFGQTVIFTL